jgi:ribokinase
VTKGPAHRVFVVGSVNIDLMVRLPVLPRPGETVTGGEFTSGYGGKGANQAVAAARIGGHVVFIGAVGDDEGGRRVRAELATEGVDVRYLGTSSRPTGTALGLIDATSGQNVWGIASGANLDVGADLVRSGLREAGPGDVVTAVNEVPAASVAAAAEAAEAQGAHFLLNAAPARPAGPDFWARCNTLIANEIEIKQLGVVDVEALHRLGVDVITVTHGPDGAQVFRAGRTRVHVPALMVSVTDTTGAGDAFVGAYAVAITEGHEPGLAARWGTAAGSLACRGVGARTSLAARTELLAAARSINTG